MADLIALGRSGDHQALHRSADTLRRDGRWTVLTALELACAWTLAGDLDQADHLVLEADALDPSLALVPDVWGLWPPPPPAPEADPTDRQAAAALAVRYRAWRTPDVQGLWRELRPRLQADWRLVLEPPLLDQLLVLGRATVHPADPLLEPSLEAVAAALVADAEIAAEPGASHRFWQLMARLRPRWALATIRAADLALSRGELDGCARLLDQPPDDARTNPWFHDVSARYAVQIGAVDQALQAWEEAIRLTEADPTGSSLADLFDQRRREARRGPGVLQVRSLANRGDMAAANHLLERLLEDDPQWQPLRSLRDQLKPPTPHTPAAVLSIAETPSLDGEGAAADAIAQLLDRAEAYLAQRGLPIPPAQLPAVTADPSAHEQHLDAWSRQLSEFEARYALA